MKLEDQRNIVQKNDNNLDPQFLTFRYNTSNIQTSPRIVNSQRMEYKSLQKYSFPDFPISECQEIEKVHKAQKYTQKQLRSVKSHERLPGLKHVFQNYDNDDEKVVADEEMEEKRNKSLKKTLVRLRKNMERQKRLSMELDEEIEQIKQQLQKDNIEIKKQLESIEELEEICEFNIEGCQNLKCDLQQTKIRNQQLIEQQEQFERSMESSQISVQTTRQESLKNGAYVSKLKEGLVQLKQMKNYTSSSVSKLKVNINLMCQYLNEVQNIDQQILQIQTG